MDVVRTNIEKIGGTVELSSVEGRGSRFTIRIPLTLTIVSALIVDCCGERFAMPQSSVIELVGAGGGSGRTIETINGAPVLRLRDRLLPLISLERTMRLATRQPADEQSILVTRVGSLSFGIIVDRVFDTEEIVVKPAASILRAIPFYSGATILGDGAVIMILDPKGLAACIGAIETNETDHAARANAARTSDNVQLLVVRGAGGALKATPLQLVSRIEEVPAAAIEHADGRPVLQYRGRLMPLVALDEMTAIAEAGRTRPVIVFDDASRAIGLVVEEIVDIVDQPLLREFRAQAPGVLGSLVVGDKVTDVIDLAYYWRRGASGGTEAAPSPNRRALIIEASAFQRNLLSPLLTMAGFDVTLAPDAAAAAALIAQGAGFDVVLTDMASQDAAGLGSAPVVGLYDDVSAQPAATPHGFASTACRLDRDSLLETIDALTRKAA